MLVPSRTDTRWFHNWVYGKAELRFVKGRLHFNDSKDSAPFPSLVAVYRGPGKATNEMGSWYRELLNKINTDVEDVTVGEWTSAEGILRVRIDEGERAKRQLKELKDALGAAFERLDGEGK